MIWIIVVILLILFALRLLNSFFGGFESKFSVCEKCAKIPLVSNKISIASYNLGLLSIKLFGFKLLEPASFIPQRLKTFPKKIIASNVDVLFFQEIYKEKHKKYLIKKLKKEYPYSLYYKKKMKFDFSLQNWLLMISKFPIVSYKFVPFKNLMLHERIIVNKWFLIASLNIWNGKNISVINWHNTARWIFANETKKIVIDYKTKQIMQILNYAKNQTIDFVVWDYNCDSKFYPEVYKNFEKNDFLEVFEINKPWEKIVTWDIKNPLTYSKYFSDTPSQKDDHIFVYKNYLKNIDIENVKVLFDENDFVNWDVAMPLSDHFGVWVWIGRW